MSRAPSARPDSCVTSLWEEWYHQAAPARRQAVVALAARQGVLLTRELDLAEGAGSRAAGGAQARRPALTALLNGHVRDLEPIRPSCPDLADADLDPYQREAVARAVQTPDVCLIQGLPGTGKSRVLTEVVVQAVGRGERVLLLAPTGAAVDQVLERLGTSTAVCPLRCLGPDEPVQALSPCIRRLTLPERVRFFQEHTLPRARQTLAALSESLDVRRREEGLWARFAEILRCHEEVSARLREREERRSRVGAEVEAELDGSAEGDPSALRIQWQACVRLHDETLVRIDGRLAELRAEVEKVRGERQQAEIEQEKLRPLVEARRARTWWTGAWWRAVFQGNLDDRFEQLGKRLEELGAATGRLEEEVAGQQAERARAEEQFRAERLRLVSTEAARRLAELDAQAAALSAEQGRLQQEWETTCGQLSADTEAPAAMTAAVVEDGRRAWERRRQREEEERELAQQWVKAVESALPTLPERLAGCANLVACTTSALAGDVHFGERAGAGVEFDLLVLDEAHQVTESEFLQAARRARRWVLVGEPVAGAWSDGQLHRNASGGPAGRGAGRGAALRTGFFQRLWQHLHTDPQRLPYSWVRRAGRLVCCLRPVAPEQERWIESEPVADRPEVELRIVAAPRLPSRLVQVTFPEATSISEAKEYLYHELEELTVQAHGSALHWVEGPDQVILELGGPVEADAVPVQLGEGISELVAVGSPSKPDTPARDRSSKPDAPARDPHAQQTQGEVVPWRTCSLQFDRQAGWDRERVEQWVAEHLDLRDLGRTALLSVPYRGRPVLARFLSDLLFAGAYQCGPLLADQSAPGKGERPPVTFVAVPPLAREGGTRRHNEAGDRWGGGGAVTVAPRLRSVRGGAGLELDLAEPRRLEQMPAELRAELPGQGLVNYFEAQAVVRTLESLVNDPAFQAEARNWQQQAGACGASACGCEGHGPSAQGGGLAHRPALAVMALYPAQVELIRLLLRGVPALTASHISVELGLPSAFRQRECLAALVSLTRSHTHRAVSYGEDAQALALALTRGVSRLILFGDPGTLVRRSQWQGPLDHLDEAAAQRERAVAAQLVGYIQGHGPHPEAFFVQEGSGT